MSTNQRHLVITDAQGIEVTRVPLYTNDPGVTNAIAGKIRKSLRDGFYLDYPEGDYSEEVRLYFPPKHQG